MHLGIPISVWKHVPPFRQKSEHPSVVTATHDPLLSRKPSTQTQTDSSGRLMHNEFSGHLCSRQAATSASEITTTLVNFCLTTARITTVITNTNMASVPCLFYYY